MTLAAGLPLPLAAGASRKVLQMTDPFRTRFHVPDFDLIVADYVAASAKLRAEVASQIDIPYGVGPDERLDLFFPPARKEPAPVHLFIHGGYWRANRKEEYAFLAAPVIEAGAIAAIVEYAHMPRQRLGHLVDQVRRAAGWLVAHASEFGGDASRVSASGHSAGAHLAFYLVARGPHEPAFPDLAIRDVFLASGLYDLAPLRRSFLQEEIGLTEEEAARWSPLAAEIRPGARLRLAVGALETAPFHQQARDLAAARHSPLVTLAGLNHMTIVREMGRPGTEAASALQALVRRA